LNHPNPEEINRVALWTKAHERKDGTPMSEDVSNILVRQQMEVSN